MNGINNGNFNAPVTPQQTDASQTGAAVQPQEEGGQQAAHSKEKLSQLHLFLLSHCAECPGTCLIINCKKMKNYLFHFEVCDNPNPDQLCVVCERISTLIKFHIQGHKEANLGKCRKPDCRVPTCAQSKLIANQQYSFAGVFDPSYHVSETEEKQA